MSLCFQTIFNLLPYLSSIAGDELLEAESFEKECPSLWRNDVDSHPVLPLYNPPESQIQQQYLLARSVKGPSGMCIKTRPLAICAGYSHVPVVNLGVRIVYKHVQKRVDTQN